MTLHIYPVDERTCDAAATFDQRFGMISPDDMHRLGAVRGGKQEKCNRHLHESRPQPSWQMQSLTMC
jgi:hypothetical protein